MKTRLLFSCASAGLLAVSVGILSCSTSSPDPDGTGAGGAGNAAGTGGIAGSGASPGSGGSANAGGNTGTGGGAQGSGGDTPGGGGAVGGTTGGSANGGAGGTANSGGAAGTGGETAGTGGGPVVVDRPPLVVTGPGSFWQVSEPTAGGGAATVTVSDNALRKWKGFGGTFNEAGWDALLALSPEDRARAIRLLFSATEGANFKWGRIPMGASDYALDRYTLCDDCTPANVETNFSIARDEMALIPYIQAAQEIKKDILFWGSPWTPPAWMKTPQQIDGQPEAKMNGTAENLNALAIYFSRWVEEYEAKGIPIHHVQPQNEPGYVSRYPSCLWDSGLLGTFVGEHLGPTFAARNIGAEIWFGTLSNNQTYSGQINGVLGGTAGQYVKGVGLQWNTYPNINSLRQQRQDLLIMQTEHRCGNYRFTVTDNPIQNPPGSASPTPPNDYAYAVESWGWLIQWIGGGVNIYSAWNMVLDTQGANLDSQDPWEQNALLVVNRNAKELVITPTYYVFRHLSFFVDPEADVLGTSGGSALAFKNPDGSTVAVVYAATAGNVTVSMAGQTLSAQVPQQGFATFYVAP